MYKSAIVLFFFMLSLSLFSSDFEGVIQLMRQSHYDTVYYEYHVKGDQVRIDEYDMNRQIRNIFLVHLNDRKVYAINKERKLFKELSASDDFVAANQDDYTVTKTDNRKTINGYTCYQWRVRNERKKSEIAYWVTQNGFSFYDQLMDVVRNFDNTSLFYRAIHDASGFLPILAVERTLVRFEKERLVVTDIEHRAVDLNVFSIPDDYKRFDH